ncbi:dienelactone hydrolase family protein [SAR202 cluster bacterium AD-802-E10_MRT_200m]|nr:dienelactone hydrolase family protein [SAR202 cluster bacterium AD-802-E10_MRT_200m]
MATKNQTEESMVSYTGHNGDSIGAFLVQPIGHGPSPAVIVIEEAFGLVEHIKEVARHFANQGYVALAPELYSREGPPDPNDMSTVMPKMMSLPDVQAIADLEGATRYLNGLSSTSNKIGVIGFCSGGRQSLMFACNSTNINAAVDCYGGFIIQSEPTKARPVAPISMVENLNCPLLGLFGEEDQNPSSEDISKLGSILTENGKVFEFHSYPDAGHGFFADYRPSYNEEVANDAWGRVFEWFGRYLV